MLARQTLLCFVTLCASQKYLAERSAKRDSDLHHSQRSSTHFFFLKWEIAPLVHSEKFDVQRIEIEVCGQQIAEWVSVPSP